MRSVATPAGHVSDKNQVLAAGSSALGGRQMSFLYLDNLRNLSWREIMDVMKSVKIKVGNLKKLLREWMMRAPECNNVVKVMRSVGNASGWCW